MFGVRREILRGRCTYFVRIGISKIVVCFCGIDDLEVDGRNGVFYNEIGLRSSLGEISKLSDKAGDV